MKFCASLLFSKSSTFKLKSSAKTICLFTVSFLEKRFLTLSWRRPLSYRNQSIDLRIKSMDWFLYDNGLRHERVKVVFTSFYISIRGSIDCIWNYILTLFISNFCAKRLYYFLIYAQILSPFGGQQLVYKYAYLPRLRFFLIWCKTL